MILYIYKVKNYSLHSQDLENCDNININLSTNDTLEGNIEINNESINFLYKPQSNLLFLNAEKRSKKRRAFRLLYEIFKEDIEIFKPSFSKEREMIRDAPEKSIKFLHENKLESKQNLTKEYCENTLNEDYYLFEANLKYDNFNFLYYRNAIKLKNNYEKHKNEIIKLIEEYLGE